MIQLIREFPEAVSGRGGLFSFRVRGRDRDDGTWEGWLEFTPTAPGAATVFVTGIETHQHDCVALERWASGLTRVYAEGALTRARALPLHPERPAAELLTALQEVVDALDRRTPHVERESEPGIAADSRRLRARALRRIAVLRRTLPGPAQ